MNLDRRQAQYIGIGLIAVGVFMALRLWWLLPTLALAGGGVYLYMQRRQQGRINEAVQYGLWGLGLGLLFLLQFVFPGVLVLAGVSLLLRGRERQIDNQVQQLVGRVNSRRNGKHTPAPPTQVAIVEEDKPATGETTRL